nr:hypothetical protein [Tanacetum cinerariifolium]GEZ32571.1 hypothetical protein [Tanacetum cinerariifolium]
AKVLELFLQDLCGRTYEVTLQKGAKTLNSLHLKQCVRNFNMCDFLRLIVGKVPELGGSDATAEEKSATKRRKVSNVDNHINDDEAKRGMLYQQGTVQANESGRNHHLAPAMTVDPTPVWNFDLNPDLDENGNTPPVLAPVTPAGLSSNPTFEMIAEEYPGWSLADVEKMAIEPRKLANLNSRVDEDDYDEE